MSFVNIKELHDRTPEVIRQAADGNPVFITRYGKPVATLRDLSEEEQEGLALFDHPAQRRAVETARADAAAGRVTSLSELLVETPKGRKRAR
ncbi:MAG: type II toxin-antitoxin system prevent-host-death family antitoxin [Candidatus Bipolaricaulota bacterium]|jgi:prevent-host-death family protein|nr:type II toxin-antitoxin system prevent-host-death family antitoxin [Candidatus Bipolaricaulota bacterium]